MSESDENSGPSSEQLEAARETAAMKEAHTRMLREAGFNDVDLAVERVPYHAIKWINDTHGEGQEEQAERAIEVANQEMRYFRVTTRRSRFGLLLTNHGALIDLTGTVAPSEYVEYRRKHRLIALEQSPFVPFST